MIMSFLFILFLILITLNLFSSQSENASKFVKCAIIVVILIEIGFLIYWRQLIQQMTEDIMQDQIQINNSIAPIDSYCLLKEIEDHCNFQGKKTSSQAICTDLVERRIARRYEHSTEKNAYNQVPNSSFQTFPTGHLSHH